MITLHVTSEQLNELVELVTEKKEQILNLVAHYENNLEAIANAGNDAEAQRLNYEAALNENKERLNLYNGIYNVVALEKLLTDKM